MRGTLNIKTKLVNLYGITPAYAGNTPVDSHIMRLGLRITPAYAGNTESS